jgi:hypothetical protein
MLPLRNAFPALRQLSGLKHISSTSGAWAGAATSQPQNAGKEDDGTFELLPPGCSMVDPTYGLNE